MPAIDIDRESAREAAERELAKPIYPRPSPKQQLADFIEKLLDELANKGAAVPGGWFTLSVLLILLVIAVLVGIRVFRRMMPTSHADHRVFGQTGLSAAEHRAAAENAAAKGDWAEAIRHRLRALARELEQTGVVNPNPGRTANELAHDAGAVLPDLTSELTKAAETFNDVSYGELPATTDGYCAIAELDDRLRSAAYVSQPTHALAPWRRSP